MNGNCKRLSAINARSARAGMIGSGLLVLFNLADQLPLAGPISSGAIINASAYAGAALIVGFTVGYCLARHFGRLGVHEESICISGLAINPHRASFSGPVLFAPFMWDPDYVWDMIPVAGHERFVFDRATHPRCNDDDVGLMHCEIDSIIKTTGCIGGVIGSVAGGILGIAAGIAAVAFLGLACVGPQIILCAIIAAAVAAFFAYVGAYLGALLGHLVGHIIDSVSGSGEEFENIEANTCISVMGRWVIDRDHGWNEIHPVTLFSPPARDPQGNPLRGNCPDLCPPPPVD